MKKEAVTKDKFTRTDITKVMTDNGIERAKAACVALAIIKATADALTASSVIELRSLGLEAYRMEETA